MGAETISLAQARRLAIHCAGLHKPWKLSAGKRGAAEVVRKLGYVQIDTISVIERAHNHVLGTRQRGYRSEMIDKLLREREVFEYWAHAAAYLPMEDYRFYLPRMKNFYKWRMEEDFRKENGKLIKEVYQRVAKDGPVMACDFEHNKSERGPWWDWKPAKRALEVLFNTGDLMVSARDKFRRVYDVAERVVPSGVDARAATEEEVGRHFARRALEVHGVATLPEVRKMFNNRGAKQALVEMVEDGDVVAVRVAGDEEDSYVLPERLEEIPARASKRVHLLSPFDNLTIDRDRLARLFDFEYRIECYTPAAKRKYGYFTLPILWNGRLMGRLDPKAERKQKRFLVRNLVLEPKEKALDEFVSALAKALWEFARFNGCEEIVVEKTEPKGLKKALEGVLRRP